MMMKKIVISIWLMACMQFLFSQNEKLEVIKNDFPAEELCNLIIESIMQANEKEAALDPALRNQFVHAGTEVFTERLINLYDSLFTATEIKLLSDFFNSEYGKKFTDLFPRIILKMLESGQNWYEKALGLYYNSTVPIDTLSKPFEYAESELQHDKPYKYKKDRRSHGIYTDPSGRFRVNYNEKVWKVIDPSVIKATADIAFRMNEKEVYALVLCEENDLNLKELRYSAIYNLFKVSESYEITNSALRLVNGRELLSLQFDAKITSAGNIRYQNYYYSGDSFVIQFSTYCKSVDFEQNKEKMMKLLNGLTIVR